MCVAKMDMAINGVRMIMFQARPLKMFSYEILY